MLKHVLGRLGMTELRRTESVESTSKSNMLEAGVAQNIVLTSDKEIELSMPASHRWKNSSKLMIVMMIIYI